MRLGPTPIDRSTFLRQAGGLLAVAFIGPSALGRPALAHYEHHSRSDLEHPDPREGITAEHVLSNEALGSHAKRPRIVDAYDAARANPTLFDGIACACSCGGKKGTHRSLLVCFETMQPTGCGACQEEGELIGTLAKEGKTLAEIRTAVDKKFD